jgi:diguanylate cyclase (GGDEF)-like protein
MKTLACAGLAYIFVFLGLTAQAQPRALDVDLRRAEQLGWFDPEASLALLNTLEPRVHDEAGELELLTLRGFADVDSRRDEEAHKILDRLQTLETAGSRAASFSRHIVRAYLLRQTDQYEAARAELDAIDPMDVQSDLEHYRLEHVRGCVLRFLGEHEAALRAFEHALDIAHGMHNVPYAIHTVLTSSQFLLRIGNLDRATAQLQEAKKLAQEAGDEASLATILQHESDIAGRRGDHAAEISDMLEALRHAQSVGSPLLLAVVYCDLGNAYANIKDFVTSLGYSKQALALAPKVRRNGFEQTVRFNIAIAQIGLGHVAEGKTVVEHEIQAALDSGNVVDAEDSLREYAVALEAAHDWHAVEILQRDAQLRDQLMNTARQQALLELSAKFDAERKARQIDLLTRDNALKGAELRAQRSRQQFILTAALLALAICVTLGLSFRGVRKANLQLRYNSEHDALTGLPNRRYFHEHVLAGPAASSFEGCVLIIDIDHFKRINDLFGHLAGDHVLACIGKRLAATLRDSDTFVRWGGEEFLAVLPRLTDAQLVATARRLLDAVSGEPVRWEGETIRCTVSIGYASFPMRGVKTNISLHRALSLADEALYQAKRRGRNRACGLPTAAELAARSLQNA